MAPNVLPKCASENRESGRCVQLACRMSVQPGIHNDEGPVRPSRAGSGVAIFRSGRPAAGVRLLCCRRPQLGAGLADQRRRHGLDARLHRAGAADDPPGSGAVLRQHGAQEECARHRAAELCGRRAGHRPVGHGRLFAGLHARLPVPGLARSPDADGPNLRQGGRHAHRQSPGAEHSRVGVRHVPADVRDHQRRP